MADKNGTSGDSFLTLTRHEVYYIPSADLSILVDHIQFKVHRYFFERESKYFYTKLASPIATTPGSPLQGSNDSNSIILENTTADQFARFLWVFYNPKHSLYDAEVEDWEVILILATRWSFPEVKSLAIRELEKKDMPDVKRIKLYHENQVDRNILIPRYAALAERGESLTLAEGMDLGMETTLMIAQAREEARSSRLASGARSPLTPTIHGADLHKVIRELFKISPGGTDSDAEPPNTTGALKPTATQRAQQQQEQPARKHQSQAPKPPTTKNPKGLGTEQSSTPQKATTPVQPAPRTKTPKASKQGEEEAPAETTNADPEDGAKVDTEATVGGGKASETVETPSQDKSQTVTDPILVDIGTAAPSQVTGTADAGSGGPPTFFSTSGITPSIFGDLASPWGMNPSKFY